MCVSVVTSDAGSHEDVWRAALDTEAAFSSPTDSRKGIELWVSWGRVKSIFAGLAPAVADGVGRSRAASRGGGDPLPKPVAEAAPPCLYVILMVTPPGASPTPSAALPCLRSCSAVGSLGAMRVPHYVDPTMLNVVSQLSAARAAPSISKIDPLHLQRQTL